MRRLTRSLLAAAFVAQPVPAADRPPRPRPESATGYHHLGATTVDRHLAVTGRVAVTDPGVRGGTYDFVATRLLAKVDDGPQTHWLEAGWAETGWAGSGAQRVYTFDTARDTWTFHDRFALRPGDRIWFHVGTPDGVTWRAWLWWTDRWHLLAEVHLPGTGAQVEQYVEVYRDPAVAGPPPTVPRIDVDNVQVTPLGGAPARYWRAADVRTAVGASPGAGYCLAWAVSYDTWSATSC